MQKLIVVLALLALCYTHTQALHAAVKGDQDFWCIVLEADNITGTITANSHEATNATSSLDFSIDEFTRIGGSCYHFDKKTNLTAEKLTIEWSPLAKAVLQPWTMDIVFVTGVDNHKNFELANISLTAVLPSTMSKYVNHYHLVDKQQAISADETNGYTCSSNKFDLDQNSSITFTNLRVVAFAHLSNETFPSGQVFEQCAGDAKTSEIVPIVVGACLAGLVIVVLVAYLVGRARAKRQGYASV